eukprot:403356878
MGTQERNIFEDDIKRSLGPGPAQYNVIDSIKGKHRVISVNQRTERPSSNFDMSKELYKTQQQLQQDFPGPGHYNPSFTHIDRNNLSSRNQTPLKDRRSTSQTNERLRDTKSSSLKKLISSESISFNTPGPGDYRNEDAFAYISSHGGTGSHNGNSVSFTKSQRLQIIDKAQHEIPGPGMYQTDSSIKTRNNYSIMESFGPKFKIISDVPKHQIPGPGEYNHLGEFQKKVQDIRKLKARQKQKNAQILGKINQKQESVNEQNIQRSKSTLKNSRNIIELLRQPTPGPLDYSPDNQKILKHQPQCVIGTAKQRQDLAGKSQLESPSPDRYETRTKIQNNGIKFSITKRDLERSCNKNDLPGPGQYKLPSTVANLPYYEVNRERNKFTKR